MKAGNSQITAKTQAQVRHFQELGWYHSIELPTGEVIAGLQTLEQQRARLARFPIPADLSGKTVLDIGAWDGRFGFELESRGAKLTAIDVFENPRYLAARELLGSHADYRLMDICDPAVLELGSFDIVLFFGVLYHVKHPLLALEHVCALTKDLACLESYVTDAGDLAAKPSMEFYEGEELCGQFDNWVGLNCACLMAMARTAGFAQVKLLDVEDQRAHFAARRKVALAGKAQTGFVFTAFGNEATHANLFSGRGDEYITVRFQCEQVPGARTDLVLRLGDLDAVAATLSQKGPTDWQASFRLPPGLRATVLDVRLHWGDFVAAGSFEVPLGTSGSIPIDAAADLDVQIVTDGKTWEHDLVRLGPGACLSLWAAGIGPVRIDVLAVEVAGRRLSPSYLSNPDANGVRQVNIMIPLDLAAGETDLFLVADERRSVGRRLNLLNP